MTSTFAELAADITAGLNLEISPIQISYLDSEPLDVVRFNGAVPAGCTFWGMGAEKEFYAQISAHENCEIGAFVLGITPSGELLKRLTGTLGWMEEKGYLGMGEAEKIPHGSRAPPFIYYGPLGIRNIPPTAVAILCSPQSAMVALEAASIHRTHPFEIPVTGRPACSVIPFVLSGKAKVAMSLGCAGFRTFVDAAADKVVIVVRGDALHEFAAAVRQIAGINGEVHRLDLEKRKEFDRR